MMKYSPNAYYYIQPSVVWKTWQGRRFLTYLTPTQTTQIPPTSTMSSFASFYPMPRYGNGDVAIDDGFMANMKHREFNKTKHRWARDGRSFGLGTVSTSIGVGEHCCHTPSCRLHHHLHRRRNPFFSSFEIP